MPATLKVKQNKEELHFLLSSGKCGAHRKSEQHALLHTTEATYTFHMKEQGFNSNLNHLEFFKMQQNLNAQLSYTRATC